MNISHIMAAARPDSSFKITGYYIGFGFLWIVGSDWWVVWRRGEGEAVLGIGTLKGLLFVVTTAAMLYFLIKRLVNQHQAVEEALRDSQLRWQFALEGPGDGLWDWNAGTNRVFFSRQWKAMLGYAEDEIGDTLAEWETRLHPDDLSRARAEIGRYFNGETSAYVSEHRLRMKDGTYKWILDRGQIMNRTPDGRPLRVIGTHSDITARKSSEARTDDVLALVKAMLQSSPVGVIAYGPDGQAAVANQTAARLVGTDVAGLLRQNFRQLESWRRHGLLAAAEQALASGCEVVHNGPIWTSFGRSLHIETRFMRFEHQGGHHLLMILNDQTALHSNSESLRLMHAAVQAAPVGWVMTDANGIIEWVNAGFTKLTGYTAEEAIGRNPRVLKSGRHAPEFYAGMWATIKRGEVWSGEMFNQRKDGGLYHEFMTIAPIAGDTGGDRPFRRHQAGHQRAEKSRAAARAGPAPGKHRHARQRHRARPEQHLRPDPPLARAAQAEVSDGGREEDAGNDRGCRAARGGHRAPDPDLCPRH